MPGTTARLNIIRPDDWHVHLRDGDILKAVLPYTAKTFARAIIMPNLKPPVMTSAQAKKYRDEILTSVPAGINFTPLMTLYLTETTKPDDIARGHEEKIVTAIKYYPANATTNSEHGVTDIFKARSVLERMQRIGMPLLVHGEVTDPTTDIFDREAIFIDRVLHPLRKDFPELKIVFEHATTKEAVDYVRQEGTAGTLAATITPHHLLINRTTIFTGGIRPHYYCLPIAKRETHRQALVKAATSGSPMFFLGTDTAPHSKATKENACGCAGVFCAPSALALYAQVFDDAGCLENLEGFASRYGPIFYGLPVNKDMILLEKLSTPANEIKPILTGNGGEIVSFASPSLLLWRVGV